MKKWILIVLALIGCSGQVVEDVDPYRVIPVEELLEAGWQPATEEELSRMVWDSDWTEDATEKYQIAAYYGFQTRRHPSGSGTVMDSGSPCGLWEHKGTSDICVIPAAKQVNYHIAGSFSPTTFARIQAAISVANATAFNFTETSAANAALIIESPGGITSQGQIDCLDAYTRFFVHDGETYQIAICRKAVMRLNPSFESYTADRRQRVVCHELGHVMGLGHGWAGGQTSCMEIVTTSMEYAAYEKTKLSWFDASTTPANVSFFPWTIPGEESWNNWVGYPQDN